MPSKPEFRPLKRESQLLLNSVLEVQTGVRHVCHPSSTPLSIPVFCSTRADGFMQVGCVRSRAFGRRISVALPPPVKGGLVMHYGVAGL